MCHDSCVTGSRVLRCHQEYRPNLVLYVFHTNLKIIIQVGFNAGDGIVFYTVSASRTPDIVNVDEYSNVNIPGKFVFRIDASDISDGGCNTKGTQFTTYDVYYFCCELV